MRYVSKFMIIALLLASAGMAATIEQNGIKITTVSNIEGGAATRAVTASRIITLIGRSRSYRTRHTFKREREIINTG